MKNQYIVGDCLKRGLGQFADLRGARQEGQRELCLRGGEGVDTPMHTVRLFFSWNKPITL